MKDRPSWVKRTIDSYAIRIPVDGTRIMALTRTRKPATRNGELLIPVLISNLRQL
jgi:hypothetical protein